MYVSRRLSSGGADGMSCPTVPDGGTAAGEGTAIGADDIGAEACSRLLLSIAHGHGQLASVAPRPPPTPRGSDRRAACRNSYSCTVVSRWCHAACTQSGVQCLHRCIV